MELKNVEMVIELCKCMTELRQKVALRLHECAPNGQKVGFTQSSNHYLADPCINVLCRANGVFPFLEENG